MPAALMRWMAAALLAARALAADVAGTTDADARFFRDAVHPILERRCFECHSLQAPSVGGGLVLDYREGWAGGGDHGPAVVPGRPEESRLLQVLRRPDPQPATTLHEAVPSAEVAVLEDWIRRGAPDPRPTPPARPAGAGADATHWWSLRPLVAPPVPPGPAHPVDAFLEARLRDRGLVATPPADRRALARRVHFDLTGLPPTPEQLEAFLRDASPTAYEDLVQRLLDSPRHGERWARHWMDAVHFAETHGHDQDRVREHAWPYRDYLVARFNADVPYARFVEEQVAGDALYRDDPMATVALGFLAAGPWDESTLRDIREDTLDREIGRYVDRDDILATVLQTFTSTTIQCARCHDHKFDPIPQRDYYALQAVFAGVGRGNRRYDLDPATHRARRDLEDRIRAVARGETNLLASAGSRRAVADWERAHGRGAEWRVVRPEAYLSVAGATLTRQPDGSFLASGPHGPTDTYTFTVPRPLARVTAVRLEVLPDDSLPQHGPGREPNGNLHLSEFQVLAFEPGATTARRVGLHRPSADFNQEGWTIGHALDGKDATAWGIHPEEGKAHEAVFELSDPLELPEGSRLTFVLRQLHGGHCIGRLRLSVTDVEPSSHAAIQPAAIRAILATSDANRTEADRLRLASHVIGRQLEEALARMPAPARVYAGSGDFEVDGSHRPPERPRPVRLLRRGEITQPREAAHPGALSCIPVLPARFRLAAPDDEASRRAALARWITHPDNPLTWRSAVNRAWQLHFGRGIVDTPNDFGRMGSLPSHPELLDWLAVWFRDTAHGSLKQLHRLLVTSAAYQRSGRHADAAPFDQALASDADSRSLWRRPPVRLTAEEVRDAVLQASGRLDLRMGGPSDRMFDLQPGIHVTPKVDYARFDLDSAAGARRSVYRFLFRTLPDPFMDALDCPAGDQLTPVRNAGVTVQQALALWNNAFMARQAEHLADRLAREEPALDGQVRRAFELTLGRAPSEAEQRDFARHAEAHGLAHLARLLFNCNEFLFVD